MKRLFLCFCAVALTAAPGCVLFGDGTDDGSSGNDVLADDSVEPSDVNVSLCDVAVPSNACHNNSACDDNMTCFSPGQPNCGICLPIEVACAVDTDCTLFPGTVCDIPFSGCPQCNPGRDCIPKCGIVGGTICDGENPDCVDGHCLAHGCIMESDCPANFTCEGDVGLMKCVRKACVSDEDCGQCGWCVNDKCFDEPGHCDLMAP